MTIKIKSLIMCAAIITVMTACMQDTRKASFTTFEENSIQLKRLSPKSQDRLTGIWDSTNSIASFINGPFAITGLTGTPGINRALLPAVFMSQHNSLLGVLDFNDELIEIARSTDTLNMLHIAYQQIHNGLIVFGRSITFHISAGDSINAIVSTFASGIRMESTRPEISADQALAKMNLSARKNKMLPPLLGIWPGKQSDVRGSARLAWRVSISPDSIAGTSEYYIDATDGTLLYSQPIHVGINRKIYDGKLKSTTPGVLARSENEGSTGNPDVDLAYEMMNEIYRYFKDVHQLDSYDGNDAALQCEVRLRAFGPVPLDGAYWDIKLKMMLFGERYLLRDIAAHEFGHAISAEIVKPTGFNLFGEPGALNESYSDIFASIFDSDNWLIGEGLGKPLRNMADPGALGFPDNASNYSVDCDDSQSVHTNCNIYNKAFHLAAISINRQEAGAIYFRSLFYLNSTSGFKEGRFAVVRAAEDLFGKDSEEVNKIKKSFDDVGITEDWTAPDNDCKPNI